MKGNATISFTEELPPSPIKYNFHIHLSAKIGLDDRGLTKDILHYFLFFSTLFSGCGKIHLALDLIEKEHNKHYDYIIIICPMLR